MLFLNDEQKDFMMKFYLIGKKHNFLNIVTSENISIPKISKESQNPQKNFKGSYLSYQSIYVGLP